MLFIFQTNTYTLVGKYNHVMQHVPQGTCTPNYHPLGKVLWTKTFNTTSVKVNQSSHIKDKIRTAPISCATHIHSIAPSVTENVHF